MKVEFSKNGWFTKFYKFSVGLEYWEEPTKNGCVFFWTSLMSIILLPFTWWNLLIDRFVDDKADNLLMRSLGGALCYMVYLLFIIFGHGAFVSGVNGDGEAYSYIFNLVHQDNLTALWLLVYLPFLAMVGIGVSGAIIVGVIAGIVGGFSWLKDDAFESTYEEVEVFDNEGNKIDTKLEERPHVVVSIWRMIVSVKNKICPIIEWK